jgi:predicted enzyme related to lactoylglutathione lyase
VTAATGLVLAGIEVPSAEGMSSRVVVASDLLASLFAATEENRGSPMSARVVHFEVPFDDADRARSFYREVFDWQIQSMPELGYNMVSTGPLTDQGMPSEPGYIGGGMMQRQAPVTTPVITLAVDDIDATLVAIEKHGGSTVAGSAPVSDMGFAAYFTDSEGNLMGLWQSAT